MVLKKSYPALEHAISTGEKIILWSLPTELLVELEEFTKRNSLAKEKINDEEINYCCVNCLKAHAVQRAREIKLDEKRMNMLMSLFDEETKRGHDGYYLDGEKLIKID